MSGVFGYCAGPDPADATPVAEQMAARLRHLPHHRTCVTSPARNVSLGRMGIGIFNGGPGPTQSADGLVSLFLCGEFYHQRDRRAILQKEIGLEQDASDEAMALVTYLRDGAAGISALDGMFIVAIWDARIGELVLINDRYGLYPHYYWSGARGFAFGPELKAVLCAPGLSPSFDRVALAEYMRFQQILGERTWFTDVTLLPKASILSYRPAEGCCRKTRYWDWDRIPLRSDVAFEEAVQESTRLFQRAIDARTSSPHRIGAYLSSGLDSRMVVGFVDRQVPLTTFTYGSAGSYDVVYGAEIARRTGTQHRWFPFVDGHWVAEYAPLHLALTEGLHGWMHAHGMSTLDAAHSLVDVNLTGWRASGTLPARGRARFVGYGGLEVAALRDILYNELCQHLTWPGLTDDEAAGLIGGRGDTGLLGLARDAAFEEVDRCSHYPSDRLASFFRIQAHDLRSTINLNVFTRAAIEVRMPFLDYAFMDFAWSLPAHVVAHTDLREEIITRRMPSLAMVPQERDGRIPHTSPWRQLPHDAWRRTRHWVNRRIHPLFHCPARLYADYERYLRTDLKGWAEAILFDPRTTDRLLVDPVALRSLWDRHLSGRELWTVGKIAPFITIELVMRAFEDSWRT